MKGAIVISFLGLLFVSTPAFSECSATQARAFSFLDVNRTGNIEPIDHLQLTHMTAYLNVHGSGRVKRGYERYDIDKDGYVVPLDLLILINMVRSFPSLGTCDPAVLRAFAIMDELRTGVLDSYLKASHYYGLSYVLTAQRRHNKDLSETRKHYDVNQTGKLDDKDLRAFRTAGGLR